jgi:uncharacterized protein YodC (DUF2158 family)
MTDAKDGGPAFPQNDLSAYGMGPSEVQSQGMSLRDWFAGQALAGMMAAQSVPHSAEKWAFAAYTVADAMMAVRSRHD